MSDIPEVPTSLPHLVNITYTCISCGYSWVENVLGATDTMTQRTTHCTHCPTPTPPPLPRFAGPPEGYDPFAN